MLQGGTIDPAVNTLAGYTVTDNLDPSPSVNISGTIDVNTPGDYNIVVTAQDSHSNVATYTRVVTIQDPTPPPIAFNSGTFLPSTATGFKLRFDFTLVVHGSDFRFIQIELGPHPLILFILDWAHSGYIVLAFPGDQWGHSFPSNVQAVMPASALAASGGGRFERWHHNARTALMAGGSFELVVTPNSQYEWCATGIRFTEWQPSRCLECCSMCRGRCRR